MRDSDFRQVQVNCQRRFFRLLGAASSGSAVRDLAGGVQATAAPVRPWFSIFNSVVFQEPDALLDQLDDLRNLYRDAGCQAWALWVPPWQTGMNERLIEFGMKIDSTPMLMGAVIEETDLEPQAELELMADPTAQVVAEVNDLAHGVLPEWSMTAVFEGLGAPVRPYVALIKGEPAAALFALHADGDCYFWFVGTAPKFRNRHLASELMRFSLREAHDLGCATATLESTAMAESMYQRLGFRSLGRYSMWEWRAYS